MLELKLVLLFLFNILISGFVQAEPLKLNDLHLTNRAQCAIDSQSPSQSAFLILDGYNPGRLAYNVAKSMGQDSDLLAQEAMLRYRVSVAQLQKYIIQQLLQKKLPLLPYSLDKKNLPKYSQIAENCKNEVYCPELSSYLTKVWFASQKEDRLLSLKAIDDFSEKNFISGRFDYGCYLLKKFSPLQSHLYGPTIDRKGLSAIGKALSNTEENLVECSSEDRSIDTRYASFQIDILGDTKSWNQYGFDFWNSIKIYTSWAWRNAPEIKNFTQEFQSIFKNLDLEESLLYVSNGCKSLSKPECNSDNLTKNSIREFAKTQVQTDEFDQEIPDGPQKQLLEKGARAVNNDFLSLMDYDKASNWVENFKKNFTNTQWIYRNRVFNAQQNLSLIASQFTPEEMIAAVATLTQRVQEYPSLKKEITYLCTEWQLSANQEFDFIYSDIEQIQKMDVMNQQSMPTGLSVQEQIEFFKKMSRPLGELCRELDSNKFFPTQDENFNYNGLQDWAKEMLKKTLATEAAPEAPTVMSEGQFLTVGEHEIPICVNAVDCSRRVIKSAIDLLYVSSYASGFLSKGHVQSSEVFNPYNELVSCHVYDPWFQKSRTRKRFVADLMNAALFGWNNIPAYVDVDFVPDRVTSFQQLVDQSVIKFTPEAQKGHMVYSLLADLGPLAGAPCAVQISPNADKAFNFYAFGGIAINACTIKAQHDVSFKRAKNPVVNDPKDRSFCGGCVINFVGVPSAASRVQAAEHFNPLKLGVYIFRAFYRFFKGMRDNVNIPRTYDLNLNQIKETYSFYGDIPRQCVKPLLKGETCKANYCESIAAIYAEKNSQWTVKRISVKKVKSKENPNLLKATFTDEECRNDHEIFFNCDEKNHTYEFFETKDYIRNKKCVSQKNGEAT